MFATQANRAQMYAQVGLDTAVATADPHKLIMLLFDGALLAVSQAAIMMEQRNIPAKNKAINKTTQIILDGLLSSLDIKAGGELAERLAALYEYMVERLTYANRHNSKPALTEVEGLLRILRDAWAEMPRTQAVPAVR